MSLAPVVEAAALRETEDTLRELIRCARLCGMEKAALALMLRTLAEELHPQLIVEGNDTIQ